MRLEKQPTAAQTEPSTQVCPSDFEKLVHLIKCKPVTMREKILAALDDLCESSGILPGDPQVITEIARLVRAEDAIHHEEDYNTDGKFSIFTSFHTTSVWEMAAALSFVEQLSDPQKSLLYLFYRLPQDKQEGILCLINQAISGGKPFVKRWHREVLQHLEAEALPEAQRVAAWNAEITRKQRGPETPEAEQESAS